MSIEVDGSKGIQQNTTEVTKIPVGTTAQRPANPEAGMMRYNSNSGKPEFWDGTDWAEFATREFIQATGGTVTDVTDGGVNYRVHTFTSSGTFEVTQTATFAEDAGLEYLVVGGGGAGGNGTVGGSGGGAGGYRSSVQGERSGGDNNPEPTINVSEQSYSIIVGAGGSAVGDSGNDSSFGIITAFGGGGGSSTSSPGIDGGSGSGGSGDTVLRQGGSGTVNQGNDGGTNGGFRHGGGGGGALTVGDDGDQQNSGFGGGAGGSGIQSSIDGFALTRATGGGGSGNGGAAQNAGAANTGDGGDGSDQQTGVNAKPGGSGIVIVRYRIG